MREAGPEENDRGSKIGGRSINKSGPPEDPYNEDLRTQPWNLKVMTTSDDVETASACLDQLLTSGNTAQVGTRAGRRNLEGSSNAGHVQAVAFPVVLYGQ